MVLKGQPTFSVGEADNILEPKAENANLDFGLY